MFWVVVSPASNEVASMRNNKERGIGRKTAKHSNESHLA
jgi:hypothetical protein